MGRGRKPAAERWGRYDPAPRQTISPLVLVHYDRSKTGEVDPLCDYIDGADWWVVHSEKNVRQLLSAFEEQEVASLMYECVGAMVELGAHGDLTVIAMQLAYRRNEEWMLDVSLSDAGIYVQEIVEESELFPTRTSATHIIK